MTTRRAVGLARLSRARGFSLVELTIVMAVTLVLTSLLLPGLSEIREHAHRLICASNLRQTGLATIMYADDHGGALPPTYHGSLGGNHQEMMAAHRGESVDNWEGLGWLYAEPYIDSPEVFYCPSHTGDHEYSVYQQLFIRYRGTTLGGPPIYTNYHYMGDRDWVTGARRSIAMDPTLVLAIDGLRTNRDYNHKIGVNVLRGDTSVLWREDADTHRVARLLTSNGSENEQGEIDYDEIWELITKNGP